MGLTVDGTLDDYGKGDIGSSEKLINYVTNFALSI